MSGDKSGSVPVDQNLQLEYKCSGKGAVLQHLKHQLLLFCYSDMGLLESTPVGIRCLDLSISASMILSDETVSSELLYEMSFR